jgi:hypothetical protein
LPGLGARLFDGVDHRLRVRWSRHDIGLFVDSIANRRTISAKLLEERDHLGGLLLAQYRQLQIQLLAA